MRRIQIYLDEALDDHLEAQAARRGLSKAALIRTAVGRDFSPPVATNEGWEALAGCFEVGPLPEGGIDDVVYGPAR